MQEEIFKRLDGKKIAILGFGMEGKSTYKFIRKYSNSTLYILDQKDYSEDELIKNDSNVVVISDNYLDSLDKYDVTGEKLYGSCSLHPAAFGSGFQGEKRSGQSVCHPG